MNILRAEHILSTYPNLLGTKLADVYDDDDQLRAAVNTLFPGFEYPDHAHRTLSEMWARYEKSKLPLSGSAVSFGFRAIR